MADLGFEALPVGEDNKLVGMIIRTIVTAPLRSGRASPSS
jgi:hypothetical protein